MGKPYTHAQASARRYGGQPEEFLKIHELMDIFKSAVPDNRGRCITHNSSFIYLIIPKIFGTVLKLSTGREVSTSQIAEDHVLEDFRGKFIPTLQDWIHELPMRDWMNNGMGGSVPPSYQSIEDSKHKEKTIYKYD